MNSASHTISPPLIYLLPVQISSIKIPPTEEDVVDTNPQIFPPIGAATPFNNIKAGGVVAQITLVPLTDLFVKSVISQDI